MTLLELLPKVSRSSLVKSRNNTGDRGDPWGIPVCVSMRSIIAGEPAESELCLAAHEEALDELDHPFG
jgi:hypothetical protein